MKIDGKCHCGQISYEAEVDPGEVYLCHCTDCQAISGTAFRWAVPVAEANFRLLAGKPKIYVKKTGIGATNHQVFCPDCASPLYSITLDGPRFFNLRLGTARQRAELMPRAEYWRRSAQAWAADLQSSKKVDTQ